MKSASNTLSPTLSTSDNSGSVPASQSPAQSQALVPAVARRTFLATVAGAGAVTLMPPTLGSAATASGAVGPESWPQWRGPQRDGSVVEQWPSSLDESTLKVAWTKPFAPSYSGPLVDAQRVYTTETRDKKTEHVVASDRQTGETLWETGWEGAMTVPFYAKRNGDWIRSTPALADHRLLVAGIRDHLVCLNDASGERLWEIDLPASMQSKLPDFGCVCSPLIDGDSVYMQAASGLLKLDMATGNTLWHVLKANDSDSAFSSPIMAELHGVRQLLVQTRERLVGISLSDGSTLWEKQIEAFRGMNILTPTVIGNQIFTSSYGGKAWMYNIQMDNGTWSVSQAWENKHQAYMSTPVLIDGHIYLHLKNKRFSCVEAATGEIKWTTQPFGEYWSMISNGKQILALDQTGTLRLIEASPVEYKLLSERQVATTESWAHLAIAGGQLFVRHLDGLTAYTWG